MIRQSLTTIKDYIWCYKSTTDKHQCSYKMSGEQLIMVYDPTKYGCVLPTSAKNKLKPLPSNNSYIELFFLCVSDESASAENIEQFLKGIEIQTDTRMAAINGWIDSKNLLHNSVLINLIYIINFLIDGLSGHYKNLVVQSSKLNTTWDFNKLSV